MTAIISRIITVMSLSDRSCSRLSQSVQDQMPHHRNIRVERVFDRAIFRDRQIDGANGLSTIDVFACNREIQRDVLEPARCRVNSIAKYFDVECLDGTSALGENVHNI